MPRPCGHPDDLLPTPGAPWAEGECRPCWLRVNREDYRALWEGETVSARPAAGPGTELKALLASLGLTPGGSAGCGCESRAAQMNLWGVEGCRERRDEILEWLREEQAKRGWLELGGAAWKALSGGLPLSAEGLLDEAIRRARNP